MYNFWVNSCAPCFAELCVKFAQGMYSVADDGGMVTVEVQLCNVVEPTQTPVWLLLEASDGMLAISKTHTRQSVLLGA